MLFIWNKNFVLEIYVAIMNTLDYANVVDYAKVVDYEYARLC